MENKEKNGNSVDYYIKKLNMNISELAEKLKITDGAIHQWKKNGIPKKREKILIKMVNSTKMSKERSLPEIKEVISIDHHEQNQNFVVIVGKNMSLLAEIIKGINFQ